MIAELQLSNYDHTHFENVDDRQRRTMRTIRFYLDHKFGHGFWHRMVQTVSYVGPMYHNNMTLDDRILLDLMYTISKIVNLSLNYLIEDYNLFRFKK
ncbi:MAG: hypothetical protein GPJ54_14620 [Candidatus Heimdallarchaeota archaeon]|nr:hypothetical protein [Candidatus Heimdallarchaeota archaeon]